MRIQLQFTFISAFFLASFISLIGQEAATCAHFSDWNEETFEKIRSITKTNRNQPIEMPMVIHQWSNYNDNQVMGMITHLNTHFGNNDLPIEFILCNYIDYDTAIDLSNNEIQDLAEIYQVPNAINIYVADQAGSTGASTTTSDVGYSWIAISRFEPTTIVHEMGHYLGLLHTHNRFWGAELVDGSNCTTAGDRFCDTPADPNLSGEVDNMCRYIGNETDANGDFYMPDTSNFMSYAYHFCRTSFSEEQKTFMLNTIEAKYSDYVCETSAIEGNEYESGFRIFPNPARTSIFIQLPEQLKQQSFDLAIYNLSGQIVYTSKNRLDSMVDLSELMPGIYQLRILTDKNISTHQIVVQ